MLTYQFSKYLYIPVSLNILHDKRNYNLLNGNYLSCEFSTKIHGTIFNENTDVIVIDLKEIKIGDSRCFSKFTTFFEDNFNRNIIFINISDKIRSFLINDCAPFVQFDDNINAISNEKGTTLYKNSIYGSVENEISNFIKKKIKETIWEEEHLLKISNVYVNKYIDIKRIFSSPNVYYIALYELALLIRNEYFGRFDKLICCSYNGAVVATIIGQFLDKEVIHLMNLGPSISINNIDMAKKIVPRKKYLFIADMICLGTEFSMTKTIVRLQKSELVGGATIIKYLDPEYSHSIISLAEIQDNDSFDYKVFIKKSR